jgi:hypothetical protein
VDHHGTAGRAFLAGGAMTLIQPKEKLVTR